MERFLFVYSWLSSLTEGRFFRTGFSSLLRISAIALTIYLLGDAIETWQKLLSTENQSSSSGIVLPVIVQIILFIAGYMMVHLLLLRAAEIRSLYDPRYALSEIITVLARLAGELLFVATLTVTIIIALQTMGLQTGIMLPELHKLLAPALEQSNMAWIIGAGALLGFMLLVAGYLASEILEMVMKMSRNSERRL